EHFHLDDDGISGAIHNQSGYVMAIAQQDFLSEAGDLLKSDGGWTLFPFLTHGVKYMVAGDGKVFQPLKADRPSSSGDLTTKVFIRTVCRGCYGLAKTKRVA